MNTLEQVMKWHEKFGVPILETPTIPENSRCQLRLNLIREEVGELQEAMMYYDIVSAADACADILYVLLGTVCELGLQDYFEAIFNEVHRSNMSKLDENGKPVMREDGKILKSKLFTPPNLRAILSASSSLGE